MADYYPILARAVCGLATNNAQTRHELYEHAREFLVAELRRRDPQISTSRIIGERVILETAILRLESESRFMRERSPITLINRLDALRESNGNREPTSETVLDFASLLREPAEVWPAPARLQC